MVVRHTLPIDGRVMTPEQFEEYIKNMKWEKPRTSIYLHHTYIPTEATWRGTITMNAMKKYYETQKQYYVNGELHIGWDKGPHLFIAPDGIWLFYDIRRDGYHAGDQYNVGSIGVEVVGNFDKDDILRSPSWENARKALRILFHYLKLPVEGIDFHRDVSTKTCPGSRVDRAAVIAAVKATKLPSQEEEEAALPEVAAGDYAWAQKYRMLDTPEHSLQKAVELNRYKQLSPEFWNEQDPHDEGAYMWVGMSNGKVVLLRAAPPTWEPRGVAWG